MAFMAMVMERLVQGTAGLFEAEMALLPDA